MWECGLHTIELNFLKDIYLRNDTSDNTIFNQLMDETSRCSFWRFCWTQPATWNSRVGRRSQSKNIDRQNINYVKMFRDSYLKKIIWKHWEHALSIFGSGPYIWDFSSQQYEKEIENAPQVLYSFHSSSVSPLFIQKKHFEIPYFCALDKIFKASI